MKRYCPTCKIPLPVVCVSFDAWKEVITLTLSCGHDITIDSNVNPKEYRRARRVYC